MGNFVLKFIEFLVKIILRNLCGGYNYALKNWFPIAAAPPLLTNVTLILTGSRGVFWLQLQTASGNFGRHLRSFYCW